jgi:hypothetical protein
MITRAAASAVLLILAAAPAAAAPMRVALLVDTSAATSSAIVQIRAGVSAFLEALPPEHEVVLVTTGRHTQVRVPPTTDRAKLKGNAGGILPDNGPTALMDALTEVDARFMKKAGDRAPVFVILTGDGSENSKDVDEQGFNRWIAEIAGRGVTVSAVVLKTTTVNGLPEFIASTLVKATQGHYTSVGNGGGIAGAMTTLAAQLTADAARGR